MMIQDVIFCISNEQRESIYTSLKRHNDLCELMRSKGLEWESHAISLKTFADGIAELLSALPIDPRCCPSQSDPDAVVDCPVCRKKAGPAYRVTTEGRRRISHRRCLSCGHNWSVEESL
jgi:hypothetical protein